MVSGISAFKAMDTTSSEGLELNNRVCQGTSPRVDNEDTSKSQHFRTKLPPLKTTVRNSSDVQIESPISPLICNTDFSVPFLNSPPCSPRFNNMDESTSKNVCKFLTYQEATNLTLVCKFVRNRVFPHIAKAKKRIVHWQDKPFQKWNHFAFDLFPHACQFLSPEETAHASAVCKGWNSGIDRPIVWRRQCEIQGYQLRIINPLDNPLKYKSILKEPIKNERSSDLKELFRRYCIDGKVKIPRPGDMRRINMQPNPFSETGETIGQSCFWFGLMSSDQFTAGIVPKLKDLPDFESIHLECSRHIGVEEVQNEVLEIFQSVLCEGHTIWYLIMKKGISGASKDEPIEKIKEAGYQCLTIKDAMVILLLNEDFWLYNAVKLQNEQGHLMISGGQTTSSDQTYIIRMLSPEFRYGAFHYQYHPVKKIRIS